MRMLEFVVYSMRGKEELWSYTILSKSIRNLDNDSDDDDGDNSSKIKCGWFERGLVCVYLVYSLVRFRRVGNRARKNLTIYSVDIYMSVVVLFLVFEASIFFSCLFLENVNVCRKVWAFHII